MDDAIKWLVARMSTGRVYFTDGDDDAADKAVMDALVDAGALHRLYAVKLRGLGTEYGTDMSSPDGWPDDETIREEAQHMASPEAWWDVPEDPAEFVEWHARKSIEYYVSPMAKQLFAAGKALGGNGCLSVVIRVDDLDLLDARVRAVHEAIAAVKSDG